MTIKCPGCNNETMRMFDFHGQEVDSCTECGGIWFDSGELNGALSTADNGNNNVGIESSLGEHQGVSLRQCSHCQCSMQHYFLMDDFQVEVDVCHSCTGVWIDEHEREKVLQSPQIRAALEQLNQKTNVKTWLFQFLLQMPLEYNLKTKSKPWVTYGLLALNIIIFFAYGYSDPATVWVFDNFAMQASLVMQGQQVLPLLSHMFLHGDIIHLLGNMYFLYVVGDNLEDALGHSRFLAVYLLCGFAAVFAQIASDPTSTVYMVGASGAIAGLFGMYLLWFRHASLTFMFVVFQKKLSPMAFFAIWLLINIVGVWFAEGGVAYWAHIGGFIAGLIIGIALKQRVMSSNPMLAMLNSPEVKVSR